MDVSQLKIESVNALRLEPGDRLVVRFAGKLSRDQAEHIRTVLEQELSGHRCIVLDSGAELDVIRAG